MNSFNEKHINFVCLTITAIKMTIFLPISPILNSYSLQIITMFIHSCRDTAYKMFHWTKLTYMHTEASLCNILSK
jgi:hypothetical protein